MAHTELGLRERRAIEDMLNANVPVSKIAAEIGRHRSTVHREIKRNRYYDDELPNLNGYYGMTAQRSAAQRRARRRKLVRYETLRRSVIAQLKEGWSPEQIAGRLGFEEQPARVSHETIYAYVYGPDGQSEELARYLPHRRKKRQPRRRRTPRGLVFPPDRSIHERPDYVKTRETFGEWEGDLMIFERAQGKANVASLVERKTRFAVLFRNNDRSTSHLMNRLMDVMELLGEVSMWVDQTKPGALGRVLPRHVQQQGGFARPGLTDDIEMLHPIRLPDAERTIPAPAVGQAEICNDVAHAHQCVVTYAKVLRAAKAERVP